MFRLAISQIGAPVFCCKTILFENNTGIFNEANVSEQLKMQAKNKKVI
jgi:hypothetical protein